MQYIELKEQLKNFKIFNLNDIRKIEEDFDLRRLNEWQKKNYIKKIRQGFYIFSDLEINFTYRHLKPELLFGYGLRECDGHHYRMAETEKAVLDYLYFNSKIKDEESFMGARFNADEFKKRVNTEKFNKYLAAFNNKALAKRVKKFLTYIEHA
ncbi:MAG: hypothetical protein UT90_C0018G0006 [Parcubacteria group bacterium GW2011_GWA1_40_21]|nr:MAG: hypothetical protein UT90_C0018G0006 [Parcubacteria group bacterium GW2011_GWA1_40_21]